MGVQVEYPDRDGYRATPAGLYVPAELSRDRQVWTRDEVRLIERTMTLFGKRGVSVGLKCDKPECKGQLLTRHQEIDGSLVLRCEHADRVFQKSF